MKVDRKVYRTAAGTLTDDPAKAAFVALPKGAPVSPADLKREPALGRYIPIIRETEAARRKADEEREAKKNAAPPANKQADKPANKGAGKEK